MEKWRIIVFLYGAVHNTVVFSAPPSPVNVFFSSINLRNVLYWHPGNDTSPGTLFTVQYAIYGDSVEGSRGKRMNWRVVQHCRDLERSWCDLTNETWDLEQGYYARVRAASKRESSKWTLIQRRFEPKSDTTFSPPSMSIVMDKNNAIIHLRGPMRYTPDRHTPEVSMATLYPEMTYELSVHNTLRNKTRNFPVPESLYQYRLMQYDTEYCFSAKTRFLSLPFTCEASAWHCFTTPQNPVIGQMQRVIVGIVVPGMGVGILVVIVYFLCRSLRGIGHKRPQILELTQLHAAPQMFCPEEIKPQEAFFLMPCSHVLPDMLNYASQRPAQPPEPNAAWENEFEEVDYGCVVAKVTPEEGEDGSGCPARVSTSQISSYLPQEESSVNPPEEETEFDGEREGLDGEIKGEEGSNPSGNRCPNEGLLCDPLLLQTRQSEDTATSNAGQSGDFGFLRVSEETNEGWINFFNWDPKASRLVFPEVETPQLGDRGQRALTLDSVLVRQASEEERECEADTLLTNWNLVITQDQ